MKKFEYRYYNPDYQRICFMHLEYQKCYNFIQDRSKEVFHGFLQGQNLLINKNAILYIGIITP